MGKVLADRAGNPAMLNKARLETLSARQVEDSLAPHITEQLEERVMLNMQPPRLLLGALVFPHNVVIVCRHSRLLASGLCVILHKSLCIAI
jgi:hypothetical protein